MEPEFDRFLPIAAGEAGGQGLFHMCSNGLKTNRDGWTYNFSRQALADNVRRTVEFYNTELARWRQSTQQENIDDFVRYDERSISWSRDLKQDLLRGRHAEFGLEKVRRSLYRPFVACNVFFDRIIDEEVYGLPKIFPTAATEVENLVIWLKVGTGWPMFAVSSNCIPNVLPQSGSPMLPFYTYAEDGTDRRENITDWALEQFRARYHDPSISKWDIFHYIYAVLHHPEYRERYAANLRRELPRIPFVSACHPEAAESLAKPRTPNEGSVHSGGSVVKANCIDPSAHKERGPQDDSLGGDSVGEGSGIGADASVFRAFVKAGERLTEIHVHYEHQAEYPLTKTEKLGEKLDWRVTKMRLSKEKTSLIYNQFLTLSGIPPETYQYRLGNRSALEWVIDQYQVSTDKRSGITNDPNRDDDKEYILRLVGQVITVSLETVRIVKELPALGIVEASER